MKPIGDRLLVREVYADKSAGGLHIIRGAADARNNGLVRCEVLAIGPGETRELPSGEVVHLTCAQLMGGEVKVGDFVMCHRFIGIHRVTMADGTVEKHKRVSVHDVAGVCE